MWDPDLVRRWGFGRVCGLRLRKGGGPGFWIRSGLVRVLRGATRLGWRNFRNWTDRSEGDAYQAAMMIKR